MTNTHPTEANSASRAPSKAILFAFSHNQNVDETRYEEVLASPMMTLVDRPIVQHVIERLQGDGVQDLIVLGATYDRQLREFVENNDRWGLRIKWLDAQRGQTLEPMRHRFAHERVVLANTDVLPMHSLFAPALTEGITVMLGGGEQAMRWAVADSVVLETMPQDCDRGEFDQWLIDVHEAAVVPACTFQTRTLHELLASQRRLMEMASNPLSVAPTTPLPGSDLDDSIRLIGRECGPGIRKCRNVKIHRTAELSGPVFLGDNCRIGKGVRLEPNTVIGANCVIDHHAVIGNSTIEPHTYVGPWVEIHDCHLDRQQVTNTRLRASVNINDPIVLDTV